MATDSRTLKLEILAETKQFIKDMDSSGKEVESFGDKATKMGKVAAAAFAAAAAAAVAYAGKLAIDGVKAAIEDEAAQNRLANALKNVTGATEAQIASVEDQITALSLANGIADDQLRPAFQRLATATGDLTKANDGLKLALDISAATGKSVEAVSNALGKAYEGNTSSLARLGIGLSTAEIKTLGLDGTMKQLANTFGGAATVQANTLEGQIARLKVGFDEAKESVGAALLPIIQKMMDYIVNTFIPMLQRAKSVAVDPIIAAFKNNEQALRDLWNFIKTYLVPIFEGALVNAITGVGKGIAGIINIIGAVVNGIKSLVNGAIDGINAIISAYNRIPILPDIGLISKPSSATTTQSSVGGVQLPFGGAAVIPSVASSAAITASTSASVAPTPSAATVAAAAAAQPVGVSNFAAGSFRMAEAREINVYVSAPSAIDKEGFSRAVVDALNESSLRLGGGAGQFNDLPV